MSHESLFIKELTKELTEDFYYLPNRGNAGDSVIESATFDLFKTLDVGFKFTKMGSTDYHNKIVVLGGGGAIIRENVFYTQALRDCAKNAKKVIVLPHTIKDIDRTLLEFGSKIVFFCRENNTFDYISRFDTTAYLVDDIAFTLKVDRFSKELGFDFHLNLLICFLQQKMNLASGNMRFKMLLKAFDYKRITRKVIKTSEQSKTLMAFRVDGEKTDIVIPEDNFDISSMYQLELGGELLSHCATHMMIKTIDAFDEIHTNRLHVAIVSAVLGKQVKFYDNSYFKCKAVYLKSLENKYDNVEFIITA